MDATITDMSLQIGIVGLANVGKSTLFNALTNAGALAANYPFATIEPNTGIVVFLTSVLMYWRKCTNRIRLFRQQLNLLILLV